MSGYCWSGTDTRSHRLPSGLECCCPKDRCASLAGIAVGAISRMSVGQSSAGATRSSFIRILAWQADEAYFSHCSSMSSSVLTLIGGPVSPLVGSVVQIHGGNLFSHRAATDLSTPETRSPHFAAARQNYADRTGGRKMGRRIGRRSCIRDLLELTPTRATGRESRLASVFENSRQRLSKMGVSARFLNQTPPLFGAVTVTLARESTDPF